MTDFKLALYSEARKTIRNNYGNDNYDEFRFGSYPWPPTKKKGKRELLNKRELKNFIKSSVLPLPDSLKLIFNEFINPYFCQFERTWEALTKKDKNLYVKLIAFRILGYTKVKLPRNNAEYWKAIEKAKGLVDFNTKLDPHFLHLILKKSNLKSIGYDIEFFYTEKGIAVDFILEQYAYKLKSKTIVGAVEGDVVLDLGACWGDTALYFADKVGSGGKVYSFEFIPGNIEIFNKNVLLNPRLTNRIELIPHPVTDRIGKSIFFFDNGPSSKVSAESFPEQTGISKTETIDNFVKKKGLKKIDYIKMDIEGAEKLALEGSINTIKTFRPKLAIAIYHSIDDFATIPNWILDLDLNYKIFIDHFSIHTEETICFAIPQNTL